MSRYSNDDYAVAEESGEEVIRKLESGLIRSQVAPMSTPFSLPHHLFHNLNPFTHALMGDPHFHKVKKITRS